jgi:hypothetical protein
VQEAIIITLTGSAGDYRFSPPATEDAFVSRNGLEKTLVHAIEALASMHSKQWNLLQATDSVKFSRATQEAVKDSK